MVFSRNDESIKNNGIEKEKKKMKLNLKVRMNNKVFWVTFIPAVLVLIKVVLSFFGIEIDITAISDKLMRIIDAVFILLGILGIVIDPTTEGVSDSEMAMCYTKPK